MRNLTISVALGLLMFGCVRPSDHPTATPSATPAVVATATASATPSATPTPQVDMSGWKEFVAPDNSFSVLFPNKADVDHTTDEREGFEVENYALVTEFGGASYQVEWHDFPDQEKAEEHYEQYVQDARDQAGDKLLEEQEVQLDGHPGLRLRYNDPRKEDTFNETVFQVGPRFYSVLVIQKDDPNADKSHVDAVVGTFKFIH